MKRLTGLTLLTLSMLASSFSFAGYVDTNITFAKTGESLRAAGDALTSGFNGISMPALSDGNYSYVIDANSDESAIQYLGDLLCEELGNQTSQNLSLDTSEMIFQGPSASMGAGQVLLKKSSNGYTANLVRRSNMIVQFYCK